MKTATRITVVALLLLPFAGCIPEKRIVWSPDGERAAVATPKGLFLINAEGKVLDSRLTGSAARCNWFRDGRRLAAAYGAKAKQWADVADTFTLEQTSDIEKLAKALHDRLLEYDGSWNDFQIDPENKVSSAIEIGALLYMREKHAAGLPEKLGERWEQAKAIEPDLWHVQVYTLKEDKLEPGQVVLRSLSEVFQPKVSPNGKNIAFLKAVENDSGEQPALHVVPVEGGAARVVSENVAMEYDWSPDGCSLAFIRCTVTHAESSSNLYLGSLTTIRIAQPEGALLKAWEQQEDKVGVLFNNILGVRWLSDGRLMFSSAEVSLPATTHDMPQRWSLFVLDPRTPASVVRVMRRDFDQPQELSTPLFSLSPDEKRVLLPATGGRVIRYDFASGETALLAEQEDAKGGIRSLPGWRSASEICFVRASASEPGKEPTAEVVLLKEGAAKCISASWPEEMKDGWLIGK